MNCIRFLIVLSLLCMGSFSQAQNNEIDSLERVFANTTVDTVKLSTLLILSEILSTEDPAKAIQYGTQARDLASSLNLKKELAYALKFRGIGSFKKAEYETAIEDWQESLDLFTSLDDQLGVANINSNLGVIYSNLGDEGKAISHHFSSLRSSEKLNDSLRIATSLINLGLLYSGNPNALDRALESNRRALSIGESINYLDAVSYSSFNLGDIYFQQSNYDSSEYYLNRSLEASEAPIDQSAALNYLGKVYAEKNDFDQAIQNQNKAIELAAKYEAKLELAQAYLGLANSYYKKNDLNNAIENFIKSRQLSEEMGFDYELKDSYEGLANTSAAFSNWEQAFNFQKEFSSLSAQLFNVKTDDAIKNLRFSYDLGKKQDEINLLEKNKEVDQLMLKNQKTISFASIFVGIMLLLLAGLLYNRNKTINKSKKIIEMEKGRSEKLLLNILPQEIADELKEHGEAKARKFDMVTILFTDFKGFTEISSRMSPEELVKDLNEFYKAFDEIVTKHGIEKIKTIGDAYMAVGGLPIPNDTHSMDVVRAALEIRDYMVNLNEQRKKEHRLCFDVRIGIHSGAVVAGIVGTKKFAYDIWGDTVNIAARMESNSEPNKINISEVTYQFVKNDFKCQPRGKIPVKGAKDMNMFFLENKEPYKPDKEMNLRLSEKEII